MKKTQKKTTKKTATKPPAYVLVRSNMAGVHFGEIVSRRGNSVRLKNSIRLWQWNSRFTLSELAVLGVNTKQSCKFSVANPGVVEIFDCCEIADVTAVASESIRSVGPYSQ